MKVQFLGYTLEIYFYKSGYSRHFARQLLNRYWLNPMQNSHKIGLIKLLRVQSNITLTGAKNAIELMFDFSGDKPVVK